MNKDLNATHQIISLLEKSKTVTDRIIDHLPGIFASVDENGSILRANVHASSCLNTSHEEVIGLHFSKLFKPETWPLFNDRFKTVVSGRVKNSDFELPLDGLTKPRSYFWQIDYLESKSADGNNRTFFNIHGRDVTELKSALGRVAMLGKNLELAKAVQSLILPASGLFDDKNFKLAAHYEPAEITGGDFWWFEHQADKALVLMGDVTGHGTGSAMVTSLIAGSINTLKSLYVRQNKALKTDDIFAVVNESLTQLDGQPYWMTMSTIEFDFKKRQMEWKCAASPPVFHMRKGGKIDVYVDSSTHLGVPDFQVASGIVSVEHGDRVLIFTDGVFEMDNSQGAPFGMRNLQKALLRTKGLSHVEARNVIENHLKNWRGNSQLKDDSAFVLIDL